MTDSRTSKERFNQRLDELESAVRRHDAATNCSWAERRDLMQDITNARSALRELAADEPSAELRTAATRLYMSGRWTCDQLTGEQQADMWINLRDALGLPAGTATAAGLGVSEPPKAALLEYEHDGEQMVKCLTCNSTFMDKAAEELLQRHAVTKSATLDDKLAELSPERRAKVEARAAELSVETSEFRCDYDGCLRTVTVRGALCERCAKILGESL